jgi:hypothetical protein
MLKVMICSGILFAYYWFFLRNKIFHGYNRFYLLASMLLSLLLPLLKIDFWQPATQTNKAIQVLQSVSVGDDYINNMVVTAQKSNWSIEQLYSMTYWLVSIIFLLVMLRTLYLVRTLLNKYPVQQVEDVAFVNTQHESTPFSFLKYIFWNSNIDINATTGRQIFKHELAHIQQKHTHDKLFVNAVLIFCWCNPFFWLYSKELNMIHEFIADKKAVEDSDTAAFAAMILQAAYPKQQFQLTNNFFYSPIKRRLLMLSKNKNPKANYIGRIMVLPLIVLVFAAFSLKAKSAIALTNKVAEISKPVAVKISPDIVKSSIKQQSGITTDTVPVRVITGINPKLGDPLYVVNGKETDKVIALGFKSEEIELVRVIKDDVALRVYGEKGKYGVVIINLKPGNGVRGTTIASDITVHSENIGKSLGANPLVIIDNIEYPNKTFTQTAAELNVSGKFEHLDIYGAEEAMKIYGEKAKEGAIIGITKQVKEGIVDKNPNDLKTTNEEPKIYLGNNPGGKISLDNLKAAKEINVSEGYTLVNATIFLQGPGLGDKTVAQITLNSASLANAQNAFNKCQNGVKIFFDYVNVKDKNGVQQMLKSPPAFIVYDQQTADNLNSVNPEPKIYLGNSAGGKIDLDYLKAQKEISVTNGYSFVSATLYFSSNPFDKVSQINLNSNSLSPVEKYISQCKNGSVLIFDNLYLKDNNGKMVFIKNPPGFTVVDKSND